MPKRLRDPEKRKVYVRRWAKKTRCEALLHYSPPGATTPTCVCCGVTTYAFLSIDHTNGGGIAHRKSIGRSGGHNIARWLKQNNYPEGFATMCHNCNLAKGFYGMCPHQSDVRAECEMQALMDGDEPPVGRPKRRAA